VNRIDAASDAVVQHIGGYEPENAADLDQFLASLPNYFGAVAQAFRNVAETLADNFPVEPVVVERLREISATVGGMSEFAGEARAVHHAAHERELQRIEDPRPNEKFWDVSQQ
jgi:hypothetical protein